MFLNSIKLLSIQTIFSAWNMMLTLEISVTIHTSIISW